MPKTLKRSIPLRTKDQQCLCGRGPVEGNIKNPYLGRCAQCKKDDKAYHRHEEGVENFDGHAYQVRKYSKYTDPYVVNLPKQ